MVLPNLLRYTIAPTARSGSFIPPIKAHLAAHLPKPKQSSFASGRQTAKPRLEAKPLGGMLARNIASPSRRQLTLSGSISGNYVSGTAKDTCGRQTTSTDFLYG